MLFFLFYFYLYYKVKCDSQIILWLQELEYKETPQYWKAWDTTVKAVGAESVSKLPVGIEMNWQRKSPLSSFFSFQSRFWLTLNNQVVIISAWQNILGLMEHWINIVLMPWLFSANINFCFWNTQSKVFDAWTGLLKKFRMKWKTTFLCRSVLMSLCEDILVYVNAHAVFHLFNLASIQIFSETLEQCTEVEDYLPAFFGS